MRPGDQRGAVKPVVCILLTIVALYVGYKFSVPYYHYNALKSECKAIARLNYTRPDRYRRLVYEKAQSIGVPIEYGDISVTIQRRMVRITASWSEVVDLMGYYSKKLDFEIDIEE
ncbi:hypothetical protein BMS3Bbin06_01828 [bacterium BMS3Bbin06]|nr:hypothetical protein BMS3Abin08_01126 [bacterium BMS3Abin08]GBE35290.1 hypothetical protein BMS3Bbin06_01828 [bacterium BMS3Bbin06]HDO35962.1 hypothetical protein [Nitrospirota bacterium]HDY71413.1 hypothetical protein [Nitrospirota bacterium]